MSYQFITFKYAYFISVGMMILLPMIGLLMEKNIETELYSYINTFMSRPLCWAPYFIVLIFWIVYYIYRTIQRKWKYRVNDRMMILPCCRSNVIVADVLTLIGIFFSFYIIQSIVYTLGYFIFINQYPTLNISNGYFLSVLQTAYTKFFLPLNWADITRLYGLTAWISFIIVYFTHFGAYIKKGILAHISAFGFLMIVLLVIVGMIIVPFIGYMQVQYVWLINFFSKNYYLIYIVVGSGILIYTIRKFLREQYL